jgi:hypothetical protein
VRKIVKSFKVKSNKFENKDIPKVGKKVCLFNEEQKQLYKGGWENGQR